jgi:ParB family transcriptional regulator, chromosome partitioning protein
MAAKKKGSASSPAKKTAPRKKRALGRGLDALFPDIETENRSTDDFFQCDIDLISPSRFQARTEFSEIELAELVASIKKEGVIQPILVRKAETGYELIAGERRLRAARQAGLTRIPVFVREISDQQHLVFSIVENVQREDLNPIEEAEGYQMLIADFGFSQEQIAESVGKSRSAVANFLRLRNLPEHIKDSITAGEISMGHARALLGAKTPQQQNDLWKEIVQKGLSVRQTEQRLKAPAAPAEAPLKKTSSTEDRYFTDLEDNLSRQLGTKVQIKRKGKKGRVEIAFFGNDDLERLLKLFGVT